MKGLGCQVSEDGLTENESILCERIKNLELGRRDINVSLHNAIVAIQSAYVAGKNEGSDRAMVWLHNYLWGPDLLPSEDDIKLGAQAYSDTHRLGFSDLDKTVQ